MENLNLIVDAGGRFKCDCCDFVFEVYGSYVGGIKFCPNCGSTRIWIIDEMDL